jgi:steroid 5-alpha reductase family enzyme
MADTENKNTKTSASNGRLLLFAAIAVLFSCLIALAGSQGGARYVIGAVDIPVFALCAIIAFGINWLIFVPSYLARTEHYFDLTGSLTFISVMLTALALSPDQDWRAAILAVLVCIWATRLGGFLFLRVRKDGSDGRFDTIKPHFARFLLTWTLQATWVFVSSAAALAAITSVRRVELDMIALVGIAMWLSGFVIEAVADAQKRAFRADSGNDGQFISTGLWAWSRHPNYFGEILLWIGIAVIALPALSGWQYVALISPVFITLLITRVSGVPMLEARAKKRWGDDPAYQAYRKNTSRLIPRPPAA